MIYSLNTCRTLLAKTLCAIALCACAAPHNAGSALSEAAQAAKSLDPTYQTPLSAPAPAEQPAKSAESEGLDIAQFSARAAELAMQDGHIGAAAVHLSQVYDKDPSNKHVAYQLARHMRYLGALSEAEQVLRETLRRHPGDALLRLELSKSHIAAGRAAETLSELEALRLERPGDPGVLQVLGVAYDRMGRHEMAREAYAEAIENGVASASLLNNAALSRLMAGDSQKAVALLRQAVVAPGANAQVRQNLALALALDGDSVGAAQAARHALPADQAKEAIRVYTDITHVEHGWTRAARQ